MSSAFIDVIEVRRLLHRIPELAFQEVKTRELLLDYLKKLQGITIHLFSNSTGILVEYSPVEGDYLLFRADMDALPVTENTDVPYVSQQEGMMHACGHDIHMTVLLGLIYKVVETQPARNLLFLFQPAEEGMGGAQSVLEEGLIQSYNIKSAFALHVSGRLPLNTVSTKPGIFFAIPQEFDLQFIGKAAHVAYPESGRNSLTGGIEFCQRIGQFISNLQQAEKVIFNIGVMQSGTIRNVIPDKCLLQGTHRTLDKALRDLINSQIETLAGDICTEIGLDYKFNLLCTYDSVVNDNGLCETLMIACNKLNIDYREAGISMTGEDFGFFTTLYPGLLFWLGAGEQPYDLHSDKFLPDENCIPIGINIFQKLIEIL
jgi:N-acetyldiaminopimelate deacetylase